MDLCLWYWVSNSLHQEMRSSCLRHRLTRRLNCLPEQSLVWVCWRNIDQFDASFHNCRDFITPFYQHLRHSERGLHFSKDINPTLRVQMAQYDTRSLARSLANGGLIWRSKGVLARVGYTTVCRLIKATCLRKRALKKCQPLKKGLIKCSSSGRSGVTYERNEKLSGYLLSFTDELPLFGKSSETGLSQTPAPPTSNFETTDERLKRFHVNGALVNHLRK